MTIRRTEDLKAYIQQKYPQLHPKKSDIVKIGVRIYMYYVANDGTLQHVRHSRPCVQSHYNLGFPCAWGTVYQRRQGVL